jgi:hypothetical protein
MITAVRILTMIGTPGIRFAGATANAVAASKHSHLAKQARSGPLLPPSLYVPLTDCTFRSIPVDGSIDTRRC